MVIEPKHVGVVLM